MKNMLRSFLATCDSTRIEGVAKHGGGTTSLSVLSNSDALALARICDGRNVSVLMFPPSYILVAPCLFGFHPARSHPFDLWGWSVLSWLGSDWAALWLWCRQHPLQLLFPAAACLGLWHRLLFTLLLPRTDASCVLSS